MNIPFKGGSRLGRSLHGWRSSYATDCRSVDPGANPGPCSIISCFRGYSLKRIRVCGFSEDPNDELIPPFSIFCVRC